MFSESTRQLVHVGALAFAGALRYLDWRQAAAMALAALVFNLFLLPRLAPQILRPADRQGWSGIRFYPLAVLALVLAFPSRLDIVAAAWAIMAAGDGCATLVGRRWPRLRLPWNPDKTWTGLIAFVIAGSAAAVLMGAWVAPGVAAAPDPTFTVWAAVAAAMCAALVETIPIRLDDNLSVPAAAAGTLALATMVDVDALAAAWPMMAARLPAAIVINVILALSAVLARSMTLTGGIVGTLIGIVIYIGAGGAGFLLLCSSFALAVLSSQVGRARKLAAGIAEDRGGRRGAGNALANCLVGAIGAGLIAAQFDDRAGALVLVAGLTAGASDTVASEIGKAFGGTPRAVLSLERVPAGTPGAVSVVGTLAGLAAAAVMAIAAVGLRLSGFEMNMVGAVVIGATVGAFAESALASWLEPRGILNNDVLNVLNTAVASAVALAFL
jgi:uncharacterized protein (TIGR00297 family)